MTTRSFGRMILTVSVGLGAVLLILLGPDLFYAIPWPVRKLAGWAGFAGLGMVLGYRLTQVRPGDDRLPAESDRGRDPWWPAWLGVAAVAVLGVPLLQHPGNLGFGDWDLFLGKYEAARRSIAIYGQFPWWDPWTRGGFPLAANPQCGVWGVAMPLVLLCGTSVGMRLATLVCFLLAVEGMRRLARLWLGDPMAAAFAGLIYGLNGGVLVAAVAAYHLSMCYPALPWMLYYTFRLERRRRDGLWLGGWAAFNVLNGIQYFTVYTALIVGIVWLRRVVVQWQPGGNVVRFLGHSTLALGTFLALAGWRLATTGLVYRDFPRVHLSGYAESPWSILHHLLGRPTSTLLATTSNSYFWETTCYIGPVVLILAVLSLRGGWRWWHTLALLCGWLAAGSVTWVFPSYWLAHFPVFSTMHAVPRWRFMAVLGVSLAAASVVAQWNRDGRANRRWLARVAVLAVVGDYLSYGSDVLAVAFSIPATEDRFPGRALAPGEVVQLGGWAGFPAISRGYGVIYGFEPLMGYDRMARTARRFRDGPEYQGEHWTARGPARVAEWSPNRIVLQVAPRERVFINQNPGSWWWANGRPAFEGMRAAEKERVFPAVADDRGRVVLEIHPRGLALGWALHLGGALLAALTWFWFRPIRPAPTATPADPPTIPPPQTA